MSDLPSRVGRYKIPHPVWRYKDFFPLRLWHAGKKFIYLHVGWGILYLPVRLGRYDTYTNYSCFSCFPILKLNKRCNWIALNLVLQFCRYTIKRNTLTHASLHHKLILLDIRTCKHGRNRCVHHKRKRKNCDNFRGPWYNRFLFHGKERIQFRHLNELDGSYPFLPK